jgi:Flp pilus assembly protein TadG
MRNQHPRPLQSTTRRGMATLWLIIWLPVLLVLFCILVDGAHLWLARVELENALEAAAQAAVREWGKAAGGDTLIPRQMGQAYAAANIVRGDAVVLSENYDGSAVPGGPVNPNQNLSYVLAEALPTANFIFGVVNDVDTDSNPATPDELVFDAEEAPPTSPGTVLFDVLGNGNGSLSGENAWGISFVRPLDLPPPNFRIQRIEINLRGSGGSGSFVNAPPLVISNNIAPPANAVHDHSGNQQNDTFGFNMAQINSPANTQIQRTILGANNEILRFDFRADPTNPLGDRGFSPGDRFRFGINVANVSSGSGNNDADGIGRDGTTVTVTFSINGVPQPPVSAQFGDNTDSSNDCLNPANVDPITNRLVVHPSLISDLPCPATSAPNNNGQSYVLLRSSGGGRFAVRAQAIMPVRQFNFPLLGNVTTHCVQAKVTAEYDLATGKTRLIRPDLFLTP